MIVWGSGTETMRLIDLGTARCETCERERPFVAVLRYKYAHIYWIFSWISEEQHLALCSSCHNGWELEREKVHKLIGKNPIPFMRRCGILVFFGLLLSLLTFSALATMFAGSSTRTP